MFLRVFVEISEDEASLLERQSLGYTLLRVDDTLYKGCASFSNQTLLDANPKMGEILIWGDHHLEIEPTIPSNAPTPRIYFTSLEELKKAGYVVRFYSKPS